MVNTTIYFTNLLSKSSPPTGGTKWHDTAYRLRMHFYIASNNQYTTDWKYATGAVR